MQRKAVPSVPLTSEVADGADYLMCAKTKATVRRMSTAMSTAVSTAVDTATCDEA